jgi:hypothetical protein
MREHPIPQDITNYRFHIIGSMTLKQFAEVAIGCVVAFIIYSTNLPELVKWPLLLSAVGLGAAAAFLPIEERPLDHWIITFIKVLYKPTQFYWKKQAAIPEPFLYNSAGGDQQETELDLSPARRQRIKEYLTSVSLRETDGDFSQSEQQQITSVLSLFQAPLPKMAVSSTPTTPPVQKPKLSVRVRKLRSSDHRAPVGEVVVYSPPTNPRPEIVVGHGLSTLAQTKKGALKTDQVAGSIEMPEIERVKVDSRLDLEEESITSSYNSNPEEQVFFQQTAAVPSAQPAVGAAFNSNLPFPSTPTEPNKIVGMVLTPQNELIPDAIVEVQTTDGTIARAVKTNALGQFFITTPLASGDYTLIVDKDDLKFEPQKITLTGEVVVPLEVRSNQGA